MLRDRLDPEVMGEGARSEASTFDASFFPGDIFFPGDTFFPGDSVFLSASIVKRLPRKLRTMLMETITETVNDCRRNNDRDTQRQQKNQ